jgi:hypothetical protein
MFVEATRSVPRSKRQSIMGFRAAGVRNLLLHHPGIPESNGGVYPADLTFLAARGLVLVKEHSFGTVDIEVTPEGFEEYERIQREAGTSSERVETFARRFVASDDFQRRHPIAFARWSSAEGLLWHSESDEHFSAIGHYCREAAQEFASSLLEHYPVADGDPDPARVKNRVRAVVDSRRSPSGRVNAAIDSLLELWRSVVDLFQRQEHGGQKGGDPLTWEDARRVVFLTLIAMTEIDRVTLRRTDT